MSKISSNSSKKSNVFKYIKNWILTLFEITALINFLSYSIFPPQGYPTWQLIIFYAMYLSVCALIAILFIRPSIIIRFFKAIFVIIFIFFTYREEPKSETSKWSHDTFQALGSFGAIYRKVMKSSK